MDWNISIWKMPTAPPREIDEVLTILRNAMSSQKPPHDANAVRVKKLLSNWLAPADSGALVARNDEGEILGCIVCRKDSEMVRVVYMGVKFPREKIGTALLGRVVDLAKTDGIKRVRATYSPVDDSHMPFLKTHGFSEGEPIRMICGVEHFDAVLEL